MDVRDSARTTDDATGIVHCTGMEKAAPLKACPFSSFAFVCLSPS